MATGTTQAATVSVRMPQAVVQAGSAAAPTTARSRASSDRRPLPVWGYDSRGLNNVPVNGYVSGVAKKAGSPTRDLWVTLVYRATGIQVGRVRTPTNGAFSFTGLEPGAAYTIYLTDDPRAASTYNAAFYDWVIAKVAP